MPAPDFLCIGAIKSATTWLNKMCSMHPGLWVPPEKELWYFNACGPKNPITLSTFYGKHRFRWWFRKLQRGPKRFRNFWWNVRFFFFPKTDRWYASLFRPRAGQLCGECTPVYAVMSADRIEHVRRVSPQVKLIYILRHPADAYWSWLQMMQCMLPEQYCSDQFTSPQFLSRHAHLFHYRSHIERWLDIFPRNQLYCCFYDDLSDPITFMKKLETFLGVDHASMSEEHLRQPIFPGTPTPMPLAFRRWALSTFKDDVQWLAENIGGAAVHWAQSLGRHGTVHPART